MTQAHSDERFPRGWTGSKFKWRPSTLIFWWWGRAQVEEGMGEAPLPFWVVLFFSQACLSCEPFFLLFRACWRCAPSFIPFGLDDQPVFIAAGLRSVWGYCGGTEGALLGDCPSDPGSNLIQVLFKVKLTFRETWISRLFVALLIRIHRSHLSSNV